MSDTRYTIRKGDEVYVYGMVGGNTPPQEPGQSGVGRVVDRVHDANHGLFFSVQLPDEKYPKSYHYTEVAKLSD